MFTQTIKAEKDNTDIDVLITSNDATKQFKINSLDIEFIQQDIDSNNAINGELEIIVDEGLINIHWQIMEWEEFGHL